MNDPIGDLIARIRNAQMRKQVEGVDAGLAAARQRARRAKSEGFIRGYATVDTEAAARSRSS